MNDAPLRTADGATWRVAVDGLTATTVTTRPGGQELRRAKTFPSRAALDAFVAAGREQMLRVGYLPADGPLVDVLAAIDRAVAALSPGPETPADSAILAAWNDATFQEDARWLLKDGNDGALAMIAAAPGALDRLLRRVAASPSGWDLQVAGSIAAMCGSDHFVPLLRIAVLRHAAEALFRGEPTGVPDVSAMPLHALLVASGVASGWIVEEALTNASALPEGAEAQWLAVRGSLDVPQLGAPPTAFVRFVERLEALEASLGA